MENASKALVIAGSIMIVLLILSLLVLGWNNLSNIKKQQEEQSLAKQLQEFNKEYEAYNKSLLYHTDIITVVNKALDNNARHIEKITIIVKTIDETKINFSDTYKTQASLDKETISNVLNLDDKRFGYYKCTNCEYSNGKISKMEFEEVNIEE